MNTSVIIHHSPNLIVEYEGDELVFPIGFRASQVITALDNYDAYDRTPITVYIFSNTPYAPQNYRSASIDLTQIETGINLLSWTLRFTYQPFTLYAQFHPQYYDLVQRAIRTAGGQSFVVEYIGETYTSDSPYLRENFPDDFEQLRTLNEAYPYLTRMRTFVYADQSLPDPTFMPTPGAPNFLMDLSEVADPVRFWGCTSRMLVDPELETRLPKGRTYIEPLRQYIAHPESWVLSQVLEDVYVIAPEPVTKEMLSDMEYGEGGPPMFVFEKFRQPYVKGKFGTPLLPDTTYDWFYASTPLRPRPAPARNGFTLYWPTSSAADPINQDAAAEGVRFMILSSYEDWAANKNLYNDMLLYASGYQYFTSLELRHTLFLGDLYNLVEIGYPEGWIETLDANRRRILLPEDATVMDSTPSIGVIDPPGDVATGWEWAIAAYNLPADAASDRPYPFQAKGRTGFVRLTTSYRAPVIEISAPDPAYDQYTDLLTTIANAMRVSTAARN